MYDIELPCDTQAIWQMIRNDLFHIVQKSECPDTLQMTRRTVYSQDYHLEQKSDIGTCQFYQCLRKHKMQNGERLELNDIFSIGYFFEFTKILTQYWHNTHKQPYEYLFLYEENGMRGALIWDKIMEGKYDITRAKVCPMDNFILDEDGIIFVYQAMDIYGHICDDIYLKVKWKYAARWLKPEWRR